MNQRLASWYSGLAVDLFVILWPVFLFILSFAGTISNSTYADWWLYLAKNSGILVLVSLGLLLLGIWRRESTMGLRTSQFFAALSEAAVCAWPVAAAFVLYIEEQTGAGFTQFGKNSSAALTCAQLCWSTTFSKGEPYKRRARA